MDDVTLRHATHDDIGGLLAFWSVAGENGSRPADRPELLGRLLDRDAQAVLVAEAGGRILATVVSGWDGAERFCAMVLDDNASGAALWRAAGYAPQHDWSRWVKSAPTALAGG